MQTTLLLTADAKQLMLSCLNRQIKDRTEDRKRYTTALSEYLAEDCLAAFRKYNPAYQQRLQDEILLAEVDCETAIGLCMQLTS